MIRKCLIAAAAALALAAPTAGAWNSDTFQSPTGNLICKYRWTTERISCGAFSSDKVISMTRYGRPVEGNRITWRDEAWPRLAYGSTWNRGKPVSCRSLTTGMRCQNSAGWFFLIDRSRVYVGRWGQRLYWL